tara:strand:- start:48 stop:686 length:639 start_codon:yes stop_codon:yes gene_type:complete
MSYKDIVNHYENCFLKHGDSHLGVDWPRKKDAETKYRVITDALEFSESKSILDFGCGLAHYYEFLLENNKNFNYEGLELSKPMFYRCVEKHPLINFYNVDVLKEGWIIPKVDFIVMNGVFTEKVTLSHADMFDHLQELVTLAFKNAKKGVIFNVMSTQVDYERDDLFHLSIDSLSKFITEKLTRKFIIRQDYALWEYTTIILKEKKKRDNYG